MWTRNSSWHSISPSSGHQRRGASPYIEPSYSNTDSSYPRLSIYTCNLAEVTGRGDLGRALPRRRNATDCNGKEKDYESGFHYYGARYYWSELLTGWLSVDPMADKYPSMSPYNYCAWNPVMLVDPDGNDPIYGKVRGVVSKIGDDGKSDGKPYFVTGWTKHKVRRATFLGRNYTDPLTPSENVFHVPTGNVANAVQTTIDLVKQSEECNNCPWTQVEYGAHSMYGVDKAIIWDPGESMEQTTFTGNEKYRRWSITPFIKDGKPTGGNSSDVEFVWHVQPINSIPSQADKSAAFHFTYNGGMENATWFVVGAKDGKVSFLSGLGKVHTIDLNDFRKMSMLQ